ncbi:MAG TPA: antitoxin AF2212-like protein [Anaerolineae bacterium]|nr:antitoxin AF2212-like protein [Anaerolineae bacterium]
MTVKSVTAIYQKGMLKPLSSLPLVENERVEVSITRSETNNRPVLTLSGVWKGLGDPSYEDIVAVTHAAHRARLERLSSLLDTTGS